jgi:hypothetical protein
MVNFRGKAQVKGRSNPSRCKNKKGYYHSFKTQFEARPGSRVELTADQSQYKNKNSYYHNFKTLLESQLGEGLSHVFGWSTWVNPSPHKIKIVIITVFKLDSRVNPRQDLNHKSRGSTQVNVKIKIVIIIVLKLKLGVE